MCAIDKTLCRIQGIWMVSLLSGYICDSIAIGWRKTKENGGKKNEQFIKIDIRINKYDKNLINKEGDETVFWDNNSNNNIKKW